MYRNILIATDGSELADHAVEQGLALAKAVGARVTAVTVTQTVMKGTPMLMPRADDVGRYEAAVGRAAHGLLERVSERARASGVSCETVHVADMAPAEGVLEACRTHGCDLVVMATHGRRGMERLLLGSQTHAVMTMAHVPVLICR
jgi:nucleotide-binding universal stress UspA family protein